VCFPVVSGREQGEETHGQDAHATQTLDQFSKLAQEQFAICIQLDPNYLPAYVELGKCCRSAGQFQKAREIFAAGLTLAASQGQQHTQDYIRQQIEGLPRDSGPDGARDGSRG
jgi:tetratricopeptide (TPR) repeat protein